MKKSLATLTFTALALSAMAIPSIMYRYSASAESNLDSAPVASAAAQDLTATTQVTGVTLPPNRDIFALNTNNVLMVMRAGATGFTRLVRLDDGNSNFIGIDVRPADGKLYALTDTGIIYTVALGSANLGALTRVSAMSPRFNSGFQSLMDFNPVLNALRLIGSNDQNFAVVNSGGNLNATAVQTAISYMAGDVNAGADPNISAGSYTNNFVGATTTLFYAIDYDLDTFVTIQPATPGGSSATGGGKLQTIGRLVTPKGALINVAPTVDIDIYSDRNGGNSVIGVSGRTLFTIDLSQIDPNLALGTTKNVVVKGITMPDEGGGFIDIAVMPVAPTPAPTPKPTPKQRR